MRSSIRCLCIYGLCMCALLVPRLAGAEQEMFRALRPKSNGGELLRFTHLAEQSALDINRRSPGKYPFLTADYALVIPAQPTTQEQKAAAELERWLEEITGVPFPVISDADTVLGKTIQIGATAAVRRTGLLNAAEKLGDEGYAITVKDGDVFLSGGRRRGPINAVFALLEEDLGCRWYSKEVSFVPRQPELSVRLASRSYAPQLEGREPFYFESLSPLWSLRNRTNSTQVPIPQSWGGYTFWALRTHSHLMLVPPEKYLATHPEYYGQRHNSNLRDPHYLCVTNPDLVPIIADRLREILKANPNASAIMIAKEDGGKHGCFCPRCMALEQAEGTPQAGELLLVNRVAERLEKEFPKVLFCGYAYTYTLKAPRTMRPRANVGIRLCTNDLNDEPFTSVADHAGFQQTFSDWKAICPNLFIYDYWQNPSFPYAPLPNMRVIAKNIRWFADQGVREVSGLGTGTWYPSGDRTEMRAWVLAKLLWNPQWDVDELMRDFDLRFYGKAGPMMIEYDDALQASLDAHQDAMRHPAEGRRFRMDAPIYDAAFMQRATEILNRAKAADDDPAIRQRIALVGRTIESVQAAQRK